MYPTVEYVVYVVEQSAGASGWIVASSILSVVIAAAALFFSIKHIRDERKHKILTTKPKVIIQITSPELKKPGLRLSLVNCGLGPAIINRIEYSVNKKPIESDVIAELARVILADEDGAFFYNKPAKEQHLAPQESYTIVDTDCDIYQAHEVKTRISEQLDIRITYSSIYGEQFTTEL